MFPSYLVESVWILAFLHFHSYLRGKTDQCQDDTSMSPLQTENKTSFKKMPLSWLVKNYWTIYHFSNPIQGPIFTPDVGKPISSYVSAVPCPFLYTPSFLLEEKPPLKAFVCVFFLSTSQLLFLLLGWKWRPSSDWAVKEGLFLRKSRKRKVKG
jgi:hypothetical protein